MEIFSESDEEETDHSLDGLSKDELASRVEEVIAKLEQFLALFF